MEGGSPVPHLLTGSLEAQFKCGLQLPRGFQEGALEAPVKHWQLPENLLEKMGLLGTGRPACGRRVTCLPTRREALPV